MLFIISTTSTFFPLRAKKAATSRPRAFPPYDEEKTFPFGFSAEDISGHDQIL